MTPPAPPRLVVDHPDLEAAVVVTGGQVVVLDDARAPVAVATLLGTDRRGTVHVDGRLLRPRSLAGRVRRGVAVVSGAPVAPDVSVHDHLAAVLGRRPARQVLAAAPLLGGRGDDPAGVLSGGERRVLAWLRARAVASRVVVLDRAGDGMDAATLGWAADVVAAWAREDVAVLVRAGRMEERAWAALGRASPSPSN